MMVLMMQGDALIAITGVPGAELFQYFDVPAALRQ